MEARRYKKILAANEADDFIGRSALLERLTALASGTGSAVIAGAPGVGLTELLKQTYDRLFRSRLRSFHSISPSIHPARQPSTLLDVFFTSSCFKPLRSAVATARSLTGSLIFANWRSFPFPPTGIGSTGW